MFTKVMNLQFFFNFILVYLLNDKTFYGFKLIVKRKSLDLQNNTLSFLFLVDFMVDFE
jgi:hypothetical protein